MEYIWLFVWLLYFTFDSNYKLFLLNTSVCMILGGSTLKAELPHRRLLGLKSRKMCSKAADNMSSNEALHHFTTTSGNFGWLQGDIFCQNDVLLSLENDTYMTAALNPLSPLWKANNLLWRIFYNHTKLYFCSESVRVKRFGSRKSTYLEKISDQGTSIGIPQEFEENKYFKNWVVISL